MSTLRRLVPARYTIAAADAVVADNDGVLAAVADNAASQVFWRVPSTNSATANQKYQPSTAPTLSKTAVAGGLLVGAYKVGYSFVDANGQTRLSPLATITIAAGDKITVAAISDIPDNVTNVNFFMSTAADGSTLAYMGTKAVSSNAITATDLTALPVATRILDYGAPRNITATPAGTTANVTAVQVIVQGIDFAGKVITETLPAFTAGAATAVAGAKAFKRIDKITIPANGTSVTTKVGFGSLLGLPLRSINNTVLSAFLNGTKETTAPTVAVSGTSLANNTISLASTLDGHQVDVYLVPDPSV